MRWKIINDKTIEWEVSDFHSDNIEMAGFGCAVLVKYGMSENGFTLLHHPVFPSLRISPNNTRGTYQMDVPDEKMPRLIADGERIREELKKVRIDGILHLEASADGLSIVHHCYPDTVLRATYEKIEIKNTGDSPRKLDITIGENSFGEVMGPMGRNIIRIKTDFRPVILNPGESYTYYITISGENTYYKSAPSDPAFAYENRIKNTIGRLTDVLQLDTGNDTLDTMFRFAKIRAGESVFDTKFGKIHSPGGCTYYAATWCNDQVEYAGPYFAYTGDEYLLDASMNAYRMYMPFMSDEYAPIPSSVIAEGVDYWNGAGDRGDAAMYLYGASRFALTAGREDYARELLPAIEWCAEYCRRMINADGVVASKSDELEGRFPSGDANLCTSTLAYAGYLSAASLEDDIGEAEKAEEYRKIAGTLRESIVKYFSAEIHGFETYRYYEGCDVLRSWICMPMCVGIFDRADGTVDALCSDYIIKDDGMLTAEGSTTIWDRSTLYGLRGIFASGKTEKAMELLDLYCKNRLLGERVPYAVEAYPENDRKHLSGESALFCKVITEGLLDIVPTGLHSFTLKPTLPSALEYICLRNIPAHGAVLNIYVERGGYRVTKSEEDGEITLAEAKIGEKTEILLK